VEEVDCYFDSLEVRLRDLKVVKGEYMFLEVVDYQLDRLEVCLMY
jgi:hypothetical protein